MYVLISSINPLRLYLYKMGMLKFSTRDYTTDTKNLSDVYIHLTNVDINTHNKKEYNFSKVWEQMKDISVKTMLSVYDHSLKKLRELRDRAKSRNFFHLMGFDFLLDDKMKLYLLETNDRPNLRFE